MILDTHVAIWVSEDAPLKPTVRRRIAPRLKREACFFQQFLRGKSLRSFAGIAFA